MSVRQLWEGSDAAAWAKKLDGRTKILVLLMFAVLTIAVDNPRSLFILFTATLVLHFVGGTSIYKWRVMAILLLLGLWGSMFSQALFFAQTPRTPLVTLIPADAGSLGTLTGGLYIYREGILYGAVQGLRSATMLALGLFVCWTSDPRQLLQAMTAWRLSPQLAFMLVTAIRFLPVLAAETGDVIIALQLRSSTRGGRTAVVRHLPYIAKPLLARCLRRAQTLSLSVVSRGFFLNKGLQRNQLWALREKLCCACFGVVTGFIVLSKLIYLLSEQGLYFGFLRQIYDWTKLYL